MDFVSNQSERLRVRFYAASSSASTICCYYTPGGGTEGCKVYTEISSSNSAYQWTGSLVSNNYGNGRSAQICSTAAIAETADGNGETTTNGVPKPGDADAANGDPEPTSDGTGETTTTDANIGETTTNGDPEPGDANVPLSDGNGETTTNGDSEPDMGVGDNDPCTAEAKKLCTNKLMKECITGSSTCGNCFDGLVYSKEYDHCHVPYLPTSNSDDGARDDCTAVGMSCMLNAPTSTSPGVYGKCMTTTDHSTTGAYFCQGSYQAPLPNNGADNHPSTMCGFGTMWEETTQK